VHIEWDEPEPVNIIKKGPPLEPEEESKVPHDHQSNKICFGEVKVSKNTNHIKEEWDSDDSNDSIAMLESEVQSLLQEVEELKKGSIKKR
jgi:hypothetical protein